MKKLIGTKKHSLLTGFISLFMVLVITNSCSKSSSGSSGGPGPNEVWIEGNAFNPSTITVAAGTTITWTNKDGVTHSVTSNTSIFDSGAMNAGGTFPHQFAAAGSYPYHCTFHPFMVATVVVN
jgi:plastocyanin